MCKNTKKVDREQVRIIGLILIGIIWAAGALYEYVKKNRNLTTVATKRVQRNSVSTKKDEKQRRSSMAIDLKTHETKTRSDAVSLLRPEQEGTLPVITNEANAVEHNEDGASAPAGITELRRAVIWSEILRRKF